VRHRRLTPGTTHGPAAADSPTHPESQKPEPTGQRAVVVLRHWVVPALA